MQKFNKTYLTKVLLDQSTIRETGVGSSKNGLVSPLDSPREALIDTGTNSTALSKIKATIALLLNISREICDVIFGASFETISDGNYINYYKVCQI